MKAWWKHVYPWVQHFLGGTMTGFGLATVWLFAEEYSRPLWLTIAVSAIVVLFGLRVTLWVARYPGDRSEERRRHRIAEWGSEP